MKNFFLTTSEACDYIKVSKSSLYKMTSKGKIAFTKPNGGKIYFKKEDLDNWLLSNKSGNIEALESKILNHLKKNKNGKKKDRE